MNLLDFLNINKYKCPICEFYIAYDGYSHTKFKNCGKCNNATSIYADIGEVSASISNDRGNVFYIIRVKYNTKTNCAEIINYFIIKNKNINLEKIIQFPR